LVLWRVPPAVSLNELIELTYLPWVQQTAKVFNDT